MIKSKFFAWGGMLFALCVMLTACSSSDDGDGGNNVDWSSTTNGMVSSTVSGFVSNGAPMRGVTVTSGDQTTQTDFNGYYKLDKVKAVNGRVVVKFQKQDYMTVVRSMPGQNNARLDINMVWCSTKTFSAATATPVEREVVMYGTNGKMTVNLPADAYVTESGEAYTGQVKASAAYLNPDDENFSDQMPGDLSALRADNSEAQLISYGMVAVELTGADGQKLQLKEGEKATLAFPVPDKFKDSDPLPATIPLWSFDEATGLWVEEGVATYDATLKVYVGEVSHFSWHNLDYPEIRATLKVKVLDANGNAVPNIIVNIDGQRTARTNSEGIATCTVPSETPMIIWVPSESYGNYAHVYSLYNQDHPEYGGSWILDDDKIVMQKNVTLAAQETKTIELQMPANAPVISGKITNEGSGSQICIVWIQYRGLETAYVITDIDGSFSFQGPAGYTGPATFYAKYGDGYKEQWTIDITGSDQEINQVTNTSAQAGAGVLVIKGSGLNLKYNLPGVDKDWNINSAGSNLTASVFYHMDGDWGHSNMGITIANYNENQTVYTGEGNIFNFNIDSASEMVNVFTNKKPLTVNVTKSGDIYTFKIVNAEASYNDMNTGGEELPVTISAEFSAKESVN